MPIKLSASLACANPLHYAAVTTHLAEAGIDAFHFDLCDGHFAPTLLLAPTLVRALRPLTTCRFDVHLYCTHPSHFIDELAAAGADLLVVHWESAETPVDAVARIRAAGLQAGVALLPATPVPQAMAGLLPTLAQVITNMVGPAFPGQPFDPRGIENARAVAAMVRAAGASTEVVADGAVAVARLPQLLDAGCTHLVCGTSSLFRPEVATSALGEALRHFRASVDACAGRAGAAPLAAE